MSILFKRCSNFLKINLNYKKAKNFWLPQFLLLLMCIKTICTTFYFLTPTFTNFDNFLPIFILLLQTLADFFHFSPTFVTSQQISLTFYHFPPSFTNLLTLYYFLSIQNISNSFFFFHLLKYNTPTIFLNVMLKALVPYYLLYMLCNVCVYYTKP